MEVTPCLWIGTLNIVQMVALSQMANRPDSMKSLLKFQLLFFFSQKWKMYLKIHTKLQGTQSSQDSLEKEEQSWKTHTTLLQNLLQNYSN